MPEILMTVTAFEQQEYKRAAGSLERRGATGFAKLLRHVAGQSAVSLTLWDRAADIYRGWLVFDEPKGGTK